MSNPFEDIFGKPKEARLNLSTTTITHWNASEFNRLLQRHLDTLTDPENWPKGAYNRSIDVKYSVCAKSEGMQYTAIVILEWMTDLPDDEDQDDEQEGTQAEGPMIHPVNMMLNARKVD